MVSEGLYDLIAKSICVQPKRRLPPHKIIKNKWIQTAYQKYKLIARPVVLSYFANMKALKI